jgi:hypothetical protein
MAKQSAYDHLVRDSLMLSITAVFLSMPVIGW